MNERPQIVVTGVGPVSSLGIGREAFAGGLRTGASGLQPAGPEWGEEWSGRPLGGVADFDVGRYLESEKTYLDRASAFALAGSKLALKDAGLLPLAVDPTRIGVCLGTAFGCLDTMLSFLAKVFDKGAKYANSVLFSHSYANSPISLVAIEFGLRGYHSTVTDGVSSGLAAIAQAALALQTGQADVVVAGGVEALGHVLLSAMREPSRAGAPPGPQADTQAPLGEGAGLLVLETSDHASKRGAEPLCCVAAIGFGPHCERAVCFRADSGSAVTWCLSDSIGECFGASGALEACGAAVCLSAGYSPASEKGAPRSAEVASCRVRLTLERCPTEASP